MVVVATPASDPTAVFVESYTVELGSSLTLGALYVASLLLAGLRWLPLAVDLPGFVLGGERLIVLTAATVWVAALVLVPLEGLRIVGGPFSDLARPSVWLDGVTPDAQVSLAMSCAGSSLVVLSGRIGGRPGRFVAWTVPLVVALAPAWLGHSRTEVPRLLMIGADAVHLIAGAWWFVGVLAVAVLVSGGQRRGVNAEVVAQVMASFSVVAKRAVVAVTISGSTMAILIPDRFAGVVESGWGRVLLVKVVLVAVVVAVARWNERRLVMRVSAGLDDERRWRTVRTVVVAEAALVVVVVVMTGLLTQMSP